MALCNLVLDRLTGTAGGSGLEPHLEVFFEEVEALQIRGRPVITDELMSAAFNILGLIATQRARVERMAAETEKRLQDARARAGVLRELGLPRSASPGVSLSGEVAGSLLTLVAETVPVLGQRARLHRYRTYLDYLDRLETLYSRELAVIDLGLLRGTRSR